MFDFSLAVVSTTICKMLWDYLRGKAYAYEIIMYILIKEANSKVTSSMSMLFPLQYKLT